MIVVLLIGHLVCAQTHTQTPTNNTADDDMFIERQIVFMDDIIKMYHEVKNIHLSLEKLYPITVIHDGFYFVFDFNEMNSKYEFKFKTKLPEYMAGAGNFDILASFPLDFYEMKASAVISNKILENSRNHIIIFHEFVHCFQWHNGEQHIRQELAVEKQEMAKNNFSWELNFPFPYESEYFINKTLELSNAPTYENMVQYHKDMKSYLQDTEFEYMVWQEWKEGFARYIENLIRKKYGLALNSTPIEKPFDRVLFYEIGNRFIEILTNNDKKLRENIVGLFNQMKFEFVISEGENDEK